jgi:DNA-binding transcriptional MerR regulator
MIKMNELVKQTGENKSTLLYYVKEGLLPEPEKPKPNVHLYQEKCIDIVKFIRYFQHSLFYSLSQIKEILKDNTINFNNGIDMIINSLDVMAIGKRDFSLQQVLELTQIDKQTLEKYQEVELIRKDEKFSQKDIEIIQLLKQTKATEPLLLSYVAVAKELAILEHEIGSKLLQQKSDSNENHHLIFDTVLKLKPYIFNMHTLLENQRRMNDEATI